MQTARDQEQNYRVCSVGLEDIDILARVFSRTASLEAHIRVCSTIMGQSLAHGCVSVHLQEGFFLVA